MASKKVTTQTLREFQAWLEGVEELQSNGWVPDKQQWAKIRKRIANIVADTPIGPAQMPMMNPGSMRGPDVPTPAGPIPGLGMPPIPPSRIPPIPADIDMSPAAKALLGGSPKTPDSGSGDDSSFA